MANENHLKFLQQVIQEGSEARRWNNYKKDYDDVDLSKADLSNADLRDFNFTRCNLAAAIFFNADLSGADLSGANLSYTNFQRANLANAYLTQTDCVVAQFQGANMVDANLDNANLRNARMMGTYLVGSSIVDADLHGANLRGATLKFANMLGANLTGVNVDEADLSKVQLSDEQKNQFKNFERAVSDEPPQKAGTKIKPDDDHEDLFREEDCYKILGVETKASVDEITKAYRQRAKEYHPDRVVNLGEKLKIVAQREFERINHAYRSLTHYRSKPAVELTGEQTDVPEAVKNKSWQDMNIEDYLMVIESEPDNDMAYYNLGLKYFQQGLVESAIKAYQKAVEINPDNQYARHNLKLAELLLTLSKH